MNQHVISLWFSIWFHNPVEFYRYQDMAMSNEYWFVSDAVDALGSD